MRRTILPLAVLFVIAHAGASIAATCAIGGIARTCDIDCTGGICVANPLNCNSGAADGYCVICGTAGVDSIAGTAGDDWICAKGGADLVLTYPPDGDELADNGDDTVDGGGGNDEIYGAAGNDDLRGGAGNDKIDARRGMNALIGGTGDDELIAYPVSNVGGSTLCGQDGNDRLEVTGGGFSCLDCGDDQVAAGTDYDAIIFNTVNGADLGSARNCTNVNPSSDIFPPPAAACGCE